SHPLVEKRDAAQGEIRYFAAQEFRIDAAAKIRFICQRVRILGEGGEHCIGHDAFWANEFEMRIWVMREHEAKSVEQNVDTLFRRQPAQKEDLFGFALDARRRGEVCDIHAVVNMMASLCQRGEAPAHACSDEVTAAEHQIGGIDPWLDHCCVKLLEP